GIPFLLHDATLERTTSGQGVAGEKNWAALAQLDAGRWHSPQFAGESLPTLENVAHYCLDKGYLLNIEIKPTPGLESRTGTVVADEAARLWQGAAIPPLLSSFQPASLEAARTAQPQLPRGLLLDELSENWLETAQKLQCVTIVCRHTLWNANTVAEAKKAGFRTLSYTVNDEASAQRLTDLGTDGIITDRVDAFRPSA
ncbi:MAG: glycerophosphodiester phosphodiesterase family protein, partial [Polaromonas sp.]